MNLTSFFVERVSFLTYRHIIVICFVGKVRSTPSTMKNEEKPRSYTSDVFPGSGSPFKKKRVIRWLKERLRIIKMKKQSQ